MVSRGPEEHVVDPVADLRPVCPNCHAMLHRDEPPLTIESLRQLRRGGGDA
jgi:5-methylcytosine-specific restriction protein A